MYFFDTYAICEIIDANSRYDVFIKDQIVSGILNLGELYYLLIRQGDKEKADDWFERLKVNLVELDAETMRQAMTFRNEHKSKKLSVPDCVGYLLAKKHGLRFLTGDKEFANMPNVEFVK